MLPPMKRQRDYHQGALLRLEPHQGAHLNLKLNENEECPILHSHHMSRSRQDTTYQ